MLWPKTYWKAYEVQLWTLFLLNLLILIFCFMKHAFYLFNSPFRFSSILKDVFISLADNKSSIGHSSRTSSKISSQVICSIDTSEWQELSPTPKKRKKRRKFRSSWGGVFGKRLIDLMFVYSAHTMLPYLLVKPDFGSEQMWFIAGLVLSVIICASGVAIYIFFLGHSIFVVVG